MATKTSTTSSKAAKRASKSGAKTTRDKSVAKSATSSSRTPHSKSAAKSTPAGAAHKTGSKTAHGQAWTDEHSDNPSSTGHGKAKKEPAKQASSCWPGYTPVAGKARGEKGSCKPKAHQTPGEKKSDAMAAAASKLRKAGGNKAAANHS